MIPPYKATNDDKKKAEFDDEHNKVIQTNDEL